jgi:hypothetical protein
MGGVAPDGDAADVETAMLGTITWLIVIGLLAGIIARLIPLDRTIRAASCGRHL